MMEFHHGNFDSENLKLKKDNFNLNLIVQCIICYDQAEPSVYSEFWNW